MNNHEQTQSPRLPIIVFVALILLTISTVLLSGLEVGNTAALLIAMSVASIKAGLVLYFFMHLNHEPLIFKLFSPSIYFCFYHLLFKEQKVYKD